MESELSELPCIRPGSLVASPCQCPYVLRFAFAFETPTELLVITEASPVGLCRSILVGTQWDTPV